MASESEQIVDYAMAGKKPLGLNESHMPQKLTHEIINAAIAGFEAQKQHIDSKIAELRNMLDHRDGAVEGPKLKRKVSAASRRRMALAQKQRWAAIKGPGDVARWIRATEAANQRRGHETDHRRHQKALGA